MTIEELKLLYQHISEMTIHFDRMNHSHEAIKSWAKFLSDLEFDDVAAAIREHIKYDEKTPTVAKIRLRAKDIKDARIKESKAVKVGSVTYFSTGVPKIRLTSKPPHVVDLIAKAESEQKAAKPNRLMSEDEIRARQQRKERMIGELKAMKDKIEQEKQESEVGHEST